MITRRSVLLPIALLAIFTLPGCGISNVTTTLQLVIAAAEAAVGVLGSTGTIPPGTATLALNYLSAVSQATSFAATELASTDSSVMKAEKIIAKFASIAAPNLPAGTPQTILAVIQAVVQAVTNFLTSIQPAVPPGGAAIGKNISISSQDRTTLTQIKGRSDALAVRISLMRK